MAGTSHILIAAVAAAGLFSIGSVASAATYNYTVGPDNLANTPGSAFGWDGDTGPLVGNPSSGAGGQWGGSSLNVTTPTVDYASLRMDVNTIFQTSNLSVGDLSRLTYYTQKVSGTDSDFYLQIYTNTLSGQTSGWYGYRITFTIPSAGNTNWNQWDTDSNLFVTEILGGGAGATTVAVTDSNNTLSKLASTSVGDATIQYIDLHGGTTTTNKDINSNLDGVVWALSNGNVANINLVPEPASLSLLAIGGLALLGRRRRSV